MPLRCNIVRSVPVDSGERTEYNAPVLKDEPQAVDGATDLACSMPTEDRRYNQQVEFRDNVSVYMMRVPLGVEICIGDRVQSIRNQADTEVFSGARGSQTGRKAAIPPRTNPAPGDSVNDTHSRRLFRCYAGDGGGQY